MPCIDSAVSASIPSLPMPELRMKAPGTARRIVLVRLMGAPPRKQQLSTKSYGMGMRDGARGMGLHGIGPAGRGACDASRGLNVTPRTRHGQRRDERRVLGAGATGTDLPRPGDRLVLGDPADRPLSHRGELLGRERPRGRHARAMISDRKSV